MEISHITRQLYPEEQKLLRRLKAKQEKELNQKIKFNYFAIAGALGIIATYLAYIIKIAFLVFVFGTLAVLSFSIIVFMPKLFRIMKKISKEV